MLPSVFALIAGLIHIYIFLMESFLWGKPKTNKVFGMTPEQAESNRLFAFNQGFYNLFLALGASIGALLTLTNFSSSAALNIMIFSCACMLGAACVLFFSAKKLLRPALIQGLPPLIAITLFFLT